MWNFFSSYLLCNVVGKFNTKKLLRNLDKIKQTQIILPTYINNIEQHISYATTLMHNSNNYKDSKCFS